MRIKSTENFMMRVKFLEGKEEPAQQAITTECSVYIGINEMIFSKKQRKKLYGKAKEGGILTVNEEQGNFIYLWIPFEKTGDFLWGKLKLSVDSFPVSCEEIKLYNQCLFDQNDYFMFDAALDEKEKIHIINKIIASDVEIT